MRSRILELRKDIDFYFVGNADISIDEEHTVHCTEGKDAHEANKEAKIESMWSKLNANGFVQFSDHFTKELAVQLFRNPIGIEHLICSE